ncbi:MAG: M56 family metallopeptidase [Prolixibacteraceae bacterium]|nr:M56 family metallopeptidase [Prolixibacteraceae bacterium]
MNGLFNYLIESAIGLGVFTLIYRLMLQGENRFQATRLYLLLALLFSTILPFLTIRLGVPRILNSISAPGETSGASHLLETVTVYAGALPDRLSQVMLSFNITRLVYFIGALVAIFVVVSGLVQLLKLITVSRVYKMKDTRLVVTSGNLAAYSFFNFIFIGREITSQKNWKTVVYHEMEHVRQGHSFDVLFVDLMMVFQWFNPFYWVIRRLVRENHEYLADTAVLAKGTISTARYKELLLNQAIGGQFVMASHFMNVKTIKKRFKMITNRKTNQSGYFKYSMGVAIALAITLLFACEEFDKTLGKAKQGDIIYLGEFKTMQQLTDMKIKTLGIVKADQLDVLTLFPEMKEQLKGETFQLAFDLSDKVQMEMFNKIDVNSITIENSSASDLTKLEFGNAQSLEIPGEEVFMIVEEMPEYPGGEDALRKFLGSEVKYPTEASKNGIQGKVYVTFVVGSDGMVKNSKIARGVDPLLDAEALRVVNKMPKWIPGKQKGVPVNVTYTVPIHFKLQ